MLDLNPTRFTVATTDQMIAMVKDSVGRNRGPIDGFEDFIDPEGMHVLSFSMLHNDDEVRGYWLVKIKDKDEPVSLMMDNSLSSFDKNTKVAVVGDWLVGPEA